MATFQQTCARNAKNILYPNQQAAVVCYGTALNS
jgi:hypothetical protein